jgi:serine protease Do
LKDRSEFKALARLLALKAPRRTGRVIRRSLKSARLGQSLANQERPVSRLIETLRVKSAGWAGWTGHLTAAAAVAGILVFAAPLAEARPAPDSFADLAEHLSPAVVNISTTQTIQRSAEDFPMPQFPPGSPFEDLFRDFLERNKQNGAPRKVTSLGSGFVIDPSGIIVTNNHVIDSADEIMVTFPDGRSLPAKLVGHDPKADVAVLRVTPKAPLAYVKFGDSDTARVGDWVLAIGNPFGLGGSVTAGIVSARNRNIDAGPYDDFIQTDAAINRGNSGGPLFNMNGDVIGVNTAIISPSGGSIGIGFAVPAKMVQPVVDQLLKYGETRRGWLGVRIQAVTDDMAEPLKLGKARGALVAGVTEDGPAAKVGIKPGDVIVSFDGKDVPDMKALPRIVADTPIGKTADVGVVRDGQTKIFKVKVGRLEDAEKTEEAANKKPAPAKEQPAKGQQSLGLTLTAITPELRQRYKIPSSMTGVLVTAVDPKSSAADKGIRAGDIIAEVAQEKVSKPEDVMAKVKQIGPGKSVLLLVNRNGDLLFVAVRTD